MVSFRYHLVSLGALLLALAAGVVLGAGPLSAKVSNALDKPASTASGPSTATLTQLQARVSAGDAYVVATAKALVTGQLRKTRVVLVVAPGTPQPLVGGVTDLIAAAGGTVSGSVSLTKAWFDPLQATVLDGITSQLAPAGTADTSGAVGAQPAAALAAALLTRSSSAVGQATDTATALLSGLVQGGFLTQSGQPDQASSLAVLLTPATLDHPESLLALMNALDHAGKGAVVAGVTGSAAPGGVVALLRGDAVARAVVSGVDSLDLPTGRVAVVLALAQQKAGGHGEYGSGPGADAPVPRP
jgi:hypothetical protein